MLLEYVLTGDRLAGYVTHLSEDNRPKAKSQMENQREQMRRRVRYHLEAAYGLHSPGPESADGGLDLAGRFRSLWPGFDPRPPARAASLQTAMNDLLDQALAYQFPAHPRFEAPARGKNLRDVLDACLLAARSPGGRLEVEDRNLRKLLRQIAAPLQLGEQHENIFLLGDHYRQHLQRCAGGETMTVEKLRQWLDRPQEMGLPREVQNVVVLVFAEQTDRRFVRNGTPARAEEASLGRLDDRLELREQTLPSQADWGRAVAAAGAVFGLSPSPLLSAGSVARLTADVKKVAAESRTACHNLAVRLRERLQRLALVPEDADRMKTAAAVTALLERVVQAEVVGVVAALAGAEPGTTLEAMGSSRGSAAKVLERLAVTNWALLDGVRRQADAGLEEAVRIRDDLVEALSADELVVELAGALKSAEIRATALLTRLAGRTELDPPPVPDPGPRPIVAARDAVRREGAEEDLDLPGAEALLARLKRELSDGQRLRLSIRWEVDGGRNE